MKYSYIVLIAVAFVSFLLMRKSANDVVQNVTLISEQVSALPYQKENNQLSTEDTDAILSHQTVSQNENMQFSAVFKGAGQCTVFDVNKNSIVGDGHYNIFSEQGHGPCVLSKIMKGDGVAVETVSRIIDIKPLTQTLSINSKDTLSVAVLQTVLAQEGFLEPSNISGNYLSKTVAATKQFQVAHQLETTGNTGPQTRALLNTLIKTKASNPTSCPGACGYIQ